MSDCSASNNIPSGCQLCDLSSSRSCSFSQHYSFSSLQGFDHDFCLGFLLTYLKHLWWFKPSMVIRQNNFRVLFLWTQSQSFRRKTLPKNVHYQSLPNECKIITNTIITLATSTYWKFPFKEMSKQVLLTSLAHFMPSLPSGRLCIVPRNKSKVLRSKPSSIQYPILPNLWKAH